MWYLNIYIYNKFIKDIWQIFNKFYYLIENSDIKFNSTYKYESNPL